MNGLLHGDFITRGEAATIIQETSSLDYRHPGERRGEGDSRMCQDNLGPEVCQNRARSWLDVVQHSLFPRSVSTLCDTAQALGRQRGGR